MVLHNICESWEQHITHFKHKLNSVILIRNIFVIHSLSLLKILFCDKLSTTLFMLFGATLTLCLEYKL